MSTAVGRLPAHLCLRSRDVARGTLFDPAPSTPAKLHAGAPTWTERPTGMD
jgi:hypothetical protein